jgi:hypothetical protein
MYRYKNKYIHIQIGTIYLYNVQSGLPRGSFPTSQTPKMKNGHLIQKQAMPGNVFHEQKKFMSEGESSNSLNPVKKDELSEVEIAEELELKRTANQGLFMSVCVCI